MLLIHKEAVRPEGRRRTAAVLSVNIVRTHQCMYQRGRGRNSWGALSTSFLPSLLPTLPPSLPSSESLAVGLRGHRGAAEPTPPQLY